MLSAIAATALSFSIGSAVLPSLTSTRAPVVSMDLLAGDFVYGAPVPASMGLAGFSSPASFTAEMTGKVEPTAAAKPATAMKVEPMEGSFCYGAPVPASKGLPGFANPCSF